MGRSSGRRKGRVAGAAGALVVAFALGGCTGGTIDPGEHFGAVDETIAGDTATALQQVLDDAVILSGSSGGLAAVAAPWAGEWRGVTGSVGFDEGSPAVEPEQTFHLAGVTSEITCLLLLKLVDTGAVALDDPVDDYVTDIPGLDGITLEHLCRHTSGLADYYPQLRVHFMQNPGRVWSPIELISSALAAPRTGAPGQTYAYSRTNLLLLGVALERTTDRTWSDLVREYVAGPLGLTGTTLPAPSVLEQPGLIGAYAARPGPDGAPDCAARLDSSLQSSSMGGAAGGARSQLDDTVRLSQALASGVLLTEHTAREQWTTAAVPGADPWVSQGIGGMAYGPLRGLASEATGALTAAFTDPGTGLTVVVALNNSSSGQDFVRETAFALASIASKTAAVSGETQPLVELPWSVDQAKQRMQELSRCALPPAEG
ncbi:serine hydrolase domain-containing protein [Agromyces aerolatus]|uniref:serine hydrolase domain-containing protein n=1 Tax=Agromyces sp. LY-1074 TaxID=3074080 RepID=UPI00285BA9B5|nr:MULTISPECIES: serine hydrolase domain-containing protein [unclassified Agromyces]MDR5699372.1 serine hydrolase domain-containing protein [Agromyces sp. LY-1074]MDR5705668.1 serine hydrolase domain-containing protein [Agromyces sp. LY-1358]